MFVLFEKQQKMFCYLLKISSQTINDRDKVNVCPVTLHPQMTLVDEFVSINLGDMNTIKCDILFNISVDVSGKNAICLGQSKLCGNGIFCLASAVLLRTARSVTHVLSWTLSTIFVC